MGQDKLTGTSLSSYAYGRVDAVLPCTARSEVHYPGAAAVAVYPDPNILSIHTYFKNAKQE